MANNQHRAVDEKGQSQTLDVWNVPLECKKVRSETNRGSECQDCPFSNNDYCEKISPAMNSIRFKIAKSAKYKFSQDEKLELLNETYLEILEAVRNYNDKKNKISNFPGFCHDIFQKTRSKILIKLPRFREYSIVHIAKPPNGIKQYCKRNNSFVEFDENNNLIVKTKLPEKVKNGLRSLSDDDNFQKKIKSVFSNSQKIKNSYIPISHTDTYTSENGNAGTESQMEIVVPDDGNDYSRVVDVDQLQGYCSLFRKIQGIKAKKAKKCAELFQILIKSYQKDMEVKELAKQMDIKANTLTNRKKECFELFQGHIISVLKKMNTDNAKMCVQLFLKLYQPGKSQKGSGIEQKIASLAEEYQKSIPDIYSLITFCRKKAMRELGLE